MGGRARSDAEFVRRQAADRRGHPPDLVGYAWQLVALGSDLGSLPWLHRIPHPTLVVAGDDDPVMPLGNSLLLAHHLPQGRLVVAPGEGHLLLADPESMALPAIRDFLVTEDLARSRAWRDAQEVTKEVLDTGLQTERGHFHHPVSLASAAVRLMWAR
jgi:pimeloyl-ACP methyl ester carboxylesterase